MKSTIGIDISKAHLDVHRRDDGDDRRFANSKTGLKALLRWLEGCPVDCIVYEPTGRYHRQMERTLLARGLPLAKVNPRSVRRFAEAIGTGAKTDRLDARLLARFGAMAQPRLVQPNSDTLNDLKDLNQAREALGNDRTAASNRLSTSENPLIKRQLANRLRQIDRDIEALDAEAAKLIGQDPELKARVDILVTIPGVAGRTAWAVLVLMPELGTLDAKQAGSLGGVAPITRQSGTWRGKAMIRGGRPGLRKALYMPALVACRYNPDLKAVYDRLIGAGKPAKVAIVAVMRKLLVLANALIRDNRKWATNAT